MTLPTRLEAFDAEAKPDGWALDINDVIQWATSSLAECKNTEPLASKRFEELLQHLKS